MALARIIYWFQLSGRLGPIVINITRIVPDIISIIITFLIILFAFGIGIFYFVIPNMTEDKCAEKGDNGQPENVTNHSGDDCVQNEGLGLYNHTGWPKKLGEVFEEMSWSILNPGPSESMQEKDRTAQALFVTYQVLVAIIMLNLLIAMMNSTVQRLQDKKHLYWKFSRTAIWLEFMRDGVMLPPPLLPLSVALTLISRLIAIIFYGIWWIYRKCVKQNSVGVLELLGMKNRDISSSLGKSCTIDPTELKRRKAHATLMQNLIRSIDIGAGDADVAHSDSINGLSVKTMSINTEQSKSTLRKFGEDESSF